MKSLRTIFIFVVLLLFIGGLGIGVYFFATQGISLNSSVQVADGQLVVSPIPTLEDAPLSRYGAIDPAIINVLDYRPSNYGSGDISVFDVQPIGIYIPRLDEAQTEISTQMPQPSQTPITPIATATLPEPSATATVDTPTVESVVTTTPRIVYITATPEPPQVTYMTATPEPRRVVYITATPEPRQVRYITATPFDPNAPLPILATSPPGFYFSDSSIDNCAPSGNPSDGLLTQIFHRYHYGIDIGIHPDTPVLATHNGRVSFAGWSEVGYGNLVIIQSGRYFTYYGHNSRFNVEVGEVVSRGQVIAWSGNTGNSSGPHLHYEIRIDDLPVDPATFASQRLPAC